MPGPDHPIAVVPNPFRVVITLNGQVLADTCNALILREDSYPPVRCIPRADVDMTRLVRSARSTYCPYKGDCLQYILRGGGERATNAIWTYEMPLDAVSAIRGHLAFYPDRVEFAEVLE
jgi:uncharacterized protein (DUF427 family)